MGVTRTENVIQLTQDGDAVAGKFIIEAIAVEGWAKNSSCTVRLRELTTNGLLFKEALQASGGWVLNRHFPYYGVSINADGIRLDISDSDWFWFYMWVYYR
jgi:hypothetical protein